MDKKLLSRKDYTAEVLQRKNGLCCVPSCNKQAVDAHHILNRNLFVEPEEQGGYFLDNGAQLCSEHHYDAELTLISTEDLWSWCGLTPCLPFGWDANKRYDCWGNVIVSNYVRERGPLFEDDGFQKVMRIAKIAWQFSPHSNTMVNAS